ncbi:MAG: glycerol-3-phosphate 1-O-acyltransferase PlsY [Clostridia bacterium]|nr:glycerol-3-phosphate 1-O-acyltransferase PlsY [Clostridia bacterium]
MVWQLIVIAIMAYLLGSINLSIILSKAMGKGDIREQGSGNAGTTNTLRVLGVGPAIVVLIFDILKAVGAVFLGKLIIKLGQAPNMDLSIYRDLAMALSGLFVILGHNFPIYFGFRGGKGIAPSLGVILAIEWEFGLICLVFWAILVLITRMVSIGSVMACILYPVLVLVKGEAFSNRWLYLLFAVLIALLAIYRHRENIKRIYAGTENKLWKTKAEKRAELK